LTATLAASALPWPLVAQSTFRFGYAAITWRGDDRTAIDEIAGVGFRGIQLRASVVDAFAKNPAQLRDLLDSRRLTFVALSSGMLGIESAADDEFSLHLRQARFLRECGGLYLQIIDSRPNRTVTTADYHTLARRLTELGKRTADLGIRLGYHHHMGSLGEGPDEVRRILDAVDPRYVGLQLDTAHYLQGGGDPAAAIREYGSRLLFLHLKDVRPVQAAPPGARSYEFVELGRGRVDFGSVFSALTEVSFAGWIVVELDAVPADSLTPRECAETNRDFITERLGLTL
jgi:inosose dehydratase